jgi:hypothetical protein
MAEQEVAKHTKNLLGAVTAPHGIGHKLREIALEMVIIVFAVSISIWFHSLGEHRHEQAQVRTFLVGLKRDLQGDLSQMQEILAFHHDADKRFAALAKLDPAATPDPAAFDAEWQRIFANNFLVPRLGRYEGFKTAGKLTNIENDQLLDRITEFYEYTIAKNKLSSGGWLSNHSHLTKYLLDATEEDDSLQARYRALTSRRGKLLLQKMATYPQLYERGEGLLKDGQAIVGEIEAAYPDQGAAKH